MRVSQVLYTQVEGEPVLYATACVCLGAKAKLRLRNPNVIVVFILSRKYVDPDQDCHTRNLAD